MRLTILITLLSAAQCALFGFKNNGKGPEFVIELTDPKLIQHARDILSGKETMVKQVAGYVVKSKKSYNPNWSFHLTGIEFFFSSIEVCDASPEIVEQGLEEVGGHFLPGNWWCPWLSVLTREIKTYG